MVNSDKFASSIKYRDRGEQILQRLRDVENANSSDLKVTGITKIGQDSAWYTVVLDDKTDLKVRLDKDGHLLDGDSKSQLSGPARATVHIKSVPEGTPKLPVVKIKVQSSQLPLPDSTDTKSGLSEETIVLPPASRIPMPTITLPPAPSK